jgi:O-antigen ligase
LLGTGLGSFATVYPTYAQSEELLGLNYAHNDYLQVFAEGGLAGGILAAIFFVVVLIAIYRGLNASEPLYCGMSLAAGAGIFAVAIQSLSDTDLQIPSNALLFLVLTAVVSCIGERKIELMKNELE